MTMLFASLFVLQMKEMRENTSSSSPPLGSIMLKRTLMLAVEGGRARSIIYGLVCDEQTVPQLKEPKVSSLSLSPSLPLSTVDCASSVFLASWI